MIRRLELENWKTHRKTEFDFSKGTNILIGTIGSGKTSVMDAISYAFFGTFPTLQSKHVSVGETISSKPNQADYSTVCMEFEHNENTYRVERSAFLSKSKASEAKLYENGTFIVGPKPRDVNERIQKIISMDYSLFSRAVYSEQNQIDYFLKLSPRDMKEKLDDLLQLNKYELARSNAVKVSNQLKRTEAGKKSFLENQSNLFDAKKYSGLLEKRNTKEKEKAEKLLLIQGLKKELVESEKEMHALSEKEKKHKELKEKTIAMQAELTQINSRINEFKNQLNGLIIELAEARLELEKIPEKKKEFENTRKGLEEKKLQLEKLEQKEKFLSQSINELKKSMQFDFSSEKEADEKIQAEKKHSVDLQESMKKLELEMNGFEKKRKEFFYSASSCDSRIKQLSKNLESLSRAGADCPVCRRSMDEHLTKKVEDEIAEEFKKLKVQKENAEKQIAGLSEQEKLKKGQSGKLQEKIFESKNIAEKIEKAKQSLKDLEAKNADLKKCTEEKNQASKTYNNLLESFKPEQLESIQKREKLLEKAIELSLLAGKEAEKKKSIESNQKDLKELNFDEQVYSKKKEDYLNKKSRASAFENELKSFDEFLAQLVSEIKRFEEMQTAMKKIETDLKNLKTAREKMSIFTNALIATQSGLRQNMIEAINSAMENIWPKIYPYGDFVSAKINVVDSNYVVSVLQRSNIWQRVDGILSGGERMAVALTLRISISLVLTQNLGMLILDEPTHNLDSRSVSGLSMLVKAYLPSLVDQIFVITHDKEMEKAANAYLYFLEREKEQDGPTRPVLQQIK